MTSNSDYQHQIAFVSENDYDWPELCLWIEDKVTAAQDVAAHAAVQGWDLEPPPRVILIDTFGAWGRLEDINSYSKVMEKMDPVKRLRDRTGCAVVLIHHSRKTAPYQQDDPIQSALGSQALTGQADHILVMRQHDKIDDARMIHIDTRLGEESKITRAILYEDGDYIPLTREHIEDYEATKADADNLSEAVVYNCFTDDWMKMKDALEAKPAKLSTTKFRNKVKVLLGKGRLETNGHPPQSPQLAYRHAESSAEPVKGILLYDDEEGDEPSYADILAKAFDTGSPATYILPPVGVAMAADVLVSTAEEAVKWGLANRVLVLGQTWCDR